MEYKTLEELCIIQNGYTPSKKEPKYWENGDIPWFRMEDLRLNGKILYSSIKNVNKNGIKGNCFPANSIIFSTTATIGEHALVKVPFLCNQQLTHIHIKDEYKEFLSIKFLFYYADIIDSMCKKNIKSGGTLQAVSLDKFKKFQIPVPPLPVQEEIVKILDRFDTLCNDLTSGLPAEINLRKQQYEYYRDKLLNFKEVF